MRTLLGCLTIMGAWLVLGIALLGVGRAVRRVACGRGQAWRAGDFWTGLSVAVGLVFLVHLFAPIGHWLWLFIGPLALLGLVQRPRPRFSRQRVGLLTLPLGLLGALYVADRALKPATSYDSGLYHLPTLDWMFAFPAVPGLANLHGRLGFNSGSIAYTAFVGSAVPPEIVSHFANGLLAVAVGVEVLLALRVLLRRGRPPRHYAPELVLLLATPALLMPIHEATAISSPSLDLPALVVSLAAALYVGRVAAADEQHPADWVATTALLALLPVMRVQLGVFTVIAAVLLAVGVRTGRTTAPFGRRLVLAVGGIPALVWGAWTAHGIVLSGYLIYPSTLSRLPVSWAVPVAVGDRETAWIRSWARTPGQPPEQVLNDSSWLGPWARRIAADPEIRGMTLLLTAGVVVLVYLSRRGRQQSGGRPRPAESRNHPLLVIGAASAGTLVVWFLLAPDPRFSLGPLWLAAAAPAAAATSLLWPHRRAVGIVAVGVFLTVGGGFSARELLVTHQLAPQGAVGTGRWGLNEAPQVPLVAFVRDGTRFYRPAQGDQCWAKSLPCTPYVSSFTLRTPGSVRDGFNPTGRPQL